MNRVRSVCLANATGRQNEQIKGRSESYSKRRLRFGLFIFIAVLLVWRIALLSTRLSAKPTPIDGELLQIYKLLDGVPNPTHLMPVNIDRDFIKIPAFVPIDNAHRKGLIHSGVWLDVIDSAGKTLILKRGPNLVTCPNAWLLLGEHAVADEHPMDMIHRGIREELGDAILEHIKAISFVTELPLFYFRDYGVSNNFRVDRQITYLVRVEMDKAGDDLPLVLDHEVADHRWIGRSELQDWLKEGRSSYEKKGSVGSKLCHQSVLTLWETVFRETSSK